MKNPLFIAGLLFAAGQGAAQGLESAESGAWDGYYVGLAATSADVSGPEGTTDSGTQGFGFQFGYLRDVGTLVVGGEFAYVGAEFDDFTGLNLDSARLKAIGGIDAGRFLPYAFVGISNVETSVGDASINETAMNYGLGGRVALGEERRVIAGLEYLVEEVDDFGGSGLDFDNNDMSLRFDFRY
jgi:outer membrane immunogenic protein